MAREAASLPQQPQPMPQPTPQPQPATIGGPAFDARLDRFLASFQDEIVAARALKDEMDEGGGDTADRKEELKRRMDRIRDLFATEGGDFVESLERRNPRLAVSACGANTLELARGIDRLESAVKEEETKRAAELAAGSTVVPLSSLPPRLPLDSGNRAVAPLAHAVDGPPATMGAKNGTGSASFEAASSMSMAMVAKQAQQHVGVSAAPASPMYHVGGGPVGHTLSSLNNLNSDETLQLMQSDIQALKLELMRLQRSKNAGMAVHPGAPMTLSHPLSSVVENTTSSSTFSMSSVSPASKPSSGLMVGTNGLGMPTPVSLGRLAGHGVNVVKVTGSKANTLAPSYVSHLEQMKSRLDALEKKPLSRSGANGGRSKSQSRLGRTRTMGNLYDPPSLTADENINPNVTAMLTPPRSSRRAKERSMSVSSPPARVNRFSPTADDNFVMPSASQDSTPSPRRTTPRAASASQASPGARTSPARLFFDAPEEMLSRPQSHAAARDIHRYSLKVARRFGPTGGVTSAAPEPRSRSEVTVSPTRRHDSGTARAHIAGLAAGITTSDVGAPPSTIDTTGSGGRVVEEIEGDMWVRKGLLWKRWRRRYASIVSHQFFGRVMCLFSYDSSGGVISTRSQIVVLNSALCRAVREKVEIGGMQRYMFVLRSATKEYFFAAESDEIRRNWVRELREAARKDAGRLTGGMSQAGSRALRSRVMAS